VHVSSLEYGRGVRNDYPPGSHPTRMMRDALPPHIPVIGVGSIHTPAQAERVLDDGVDLVALGRILLLNADWVTKVRTGRADSLRMKLTSEAERQSLDIPPPMREYTKRSIPVTSD